MHIPPDLQHLLARERALLAQAPEQALRPLSRIEIYAAIGPTYLSTSHDDRIALIRSGQAQLTRADRVRARLALLTAEYVLPLWFSALEEFGFLEEDSLAAEFYYALSELVRLHVADAAQPTLNAFLEATPVNYATLREQVERLSSDAVAEAQRSVLLEFIAIGHLLAANAADSADCFTLDPRLVEARSVFRMPLAVIPLHTLQLARGLLDGTASARNALAQQEELFEGLGNNFGYADEDFPARAYYVCLAAAEALKQALGLGPFDRQRVTAATTDEVLEGEGAAAAPALKAYSGIFMGTLATNKYDAEKRREFWTWWIESALPRAWEAEAEQAPVSNAPTMPFQQTVRVTAYWTGLEFLFEEPPSDIFP